MPETACQHKASRLRQSPDEKLRELLRCDATALVIGPHKRTFAETAAHVDETRKTKRWAEVCAVFGEFSKAQGERNQDAGIAAVLGAVIQLMIDFTGAEKLPRCWIKMCVDGEVSQDWIEENFGGVRA